MTRALAFFAVLGTGALLLYASADFPDWGAHHSPANDSPVSLHYIEKTYSETSVPNMVTAVLADYRGYDTLFETVVIFTAGIAIMAILRNLGPGGLEGKPQGRWKSDPSNLVITTTCRLLVPVIQLFGLYVVAHGHYSPGGGFQGGVVLGASFILLAIGGDLREALSRFPERRIFTLAAVGVLIYAGFGLVCLLEGANFLDYGALAKILPGDAIEARSLSMFGVEVGVAFTVSAIMFGIYANLSTRGRLVEGL